MISQNNHDHLEDQVIQSRFQSFQFSFRISIIWLVFILISIGSGDTIVKGQIFQQVNGPPGPGPFFWGLDDIGWYWTPSDDVELIAVQSQLRSDFTNLNNDFIFSTTIYDERPALGGTVIATTTWNGSFNVEGQWVGGFFDAPISLLGGTQYFVGMAGWEQALNSVGPGSGAGINWVDTPIGEPVQNLGQGSSFGSIMCRAVSIPSLALTYWAQQISRFSDSSNRILVATSKLSATTLMMRS